MVDDLPEEGFIQGTTATETPDVDKSPVHVHEAMFGWDGWSLSAARPGKRVRHEDGDEIVEDQDANPDPVTPLHRHRRRWQTGTLPRLRYGRSYAFRVWAVDLAGNSRPHAHRPGTRIPLRPRSPRLRRRWRTSPPRSHAELLSPTLRSETAAGILRGGLTVVEQPEEIGCSRAAAACAARRRARSS